MRVKSFGHLLGLRCCCAHSDFNGVNWVQWDSGSQGYPIVRMSIIMCWSGLEVWNLSLCVKGHSGDVLMCHLQLLEDDDDDDGSLSGFSIESKIGMKFGQESICKNKHLQSFWDSWILGSFEIWGCMARALMVIELTPQYVNLLISTEGTGLGNILLWFGELESNPCRFGQGSSIHLNMRVKSLLHPPLVIWWCCAHSDFN